jgi:putative ABC transport system permease protein
MLKIIVKGLAGQRIRVFLTIFSIAVGVMVFVSISGLLQGLETSVYETFQVFSKNRDILVVPGTVDGPVAVDAVSVSTIEEMLYRGTSILVKHTDIDLFEKLATITLVEGGTPALRSECMAEYFFAQKLNISVGDPVGGYTVTGVYLHEKGFYTHVITPLVDNGYTLTEMKVDPLHYDDIAAKIPHSIPAHPLSYFFSEGTVNLHKSLQQMLGIVVVILILSVFVSMNTAVLERTWEIGILRALGAQKSFILQLFLYEGVIISLAAAVLGIALGIIFSTSLTAFISEIQQVKGIQPVVTGTVLLQAVGAPVIIGVMGSILPAYRASTMDIHECLVV